MRKRDKEFMEHVREGEQIAEDRRNAVRYLRSLAGNSPTVQVSVENALRAVLRTSDDVDGIIAQAPTNQLSDHLIGRFTAAAFVGHRIEKNTERPYSAVTGSAYSVMGLLDALRIKTLSHYGIPGLTDDQADGFSVPD